MREVDFDANNSKLVLRAGELAHEAEPGDQLWFILRANVVETRTGDDGKKGRHRLRIDPAIMSSGTADEIEQARREVHIKWLQAKLEGAADLVLKTLDNPKRQHPFIETGWAHASRGDYDQGGKTDKADMQWWAVTFKGKLRVKEPARLRSLLISGIGPAKAFGFGLLSVAPVTPQT